MQDTQEFGNGRTVNDLLNTSLIDFKLVVEITVQTVSDCFVVLILARLSELRPSLVRKDQDRANGIIQEVKLNIYIVWRKIFAKEVARSQFTKQWLWLYDRTAVLFSALKIYEETTHYASYTWKLPTQKLVKTKPLLTSVEKHLICSCKKVQECLGTGESGQLRKGSFPVRDLFSPTPIRTAASW